MKNIVRFQITKNQGNVTIDNYNPFVQENEWSDILNTLLPYTRLFEHIIIKNFISIPEELLNRLTNQYLHGAKITFSTPSRNFERTYEVPHSKPFYSYSWQPLDLSKPVPKSLATFEFNYNGKKTTYLDAIKTLKSTKYLPTDIWNALDVYSKQQIDKCREYNRGDYSFAELWYKQLMKDCMSSNIRMYSPNAKTYFEAIAEITFEKDCAEMQLQKGLRPLNHSELLFLHKYARAYGVEVPQFLFRVNTRKTIHGYTEEPERVLSGMSSDDWNKVIYDPRNAQRNPDLVLPRNIRQNLMVQSTENDKLLREAYFQLKWIMKNLKDDGLMPDYKRCPVCHEIYREHDGCDCGASQSVEFVSADNLLYGISSTYEDIDDTKDIYNELIAETFEDIE